MGLHGMRIRVSDVLSPPTLEDMRKDCQPHGGVETLRLIAERGGSVDQCKLLRIRHDIEHAEWPGQDAEEEPCSDVDEDDGDTISSYQAVSSRREYQRDALDMNMFESRYIEFEAGGHESFLRQVACDMGRPGHEMYDLVERFRKRKTVHADLSSDKERVRLAWVELGNGLARTFQRHCPGPLGEDDAGGSEDGNPGECQRAKEEDGGDQDVFNCRGATYVRQQEETSEECGNDDYHGPKPAPRFDAGDIDDPAQSTLVAREARKEARRIAFNKPDIINKFDTDGRPLPEKGVVWSQVTQAFGVEASDSMDTTWSSVVRVQRFQMNQIKHFPAAGEILTMTICGPIVRVWYMNPQRFGSSRGFSLDDPKDTYDIVKVFALFSGPVSNYLPHWKPVAGPKGRFAMKTIDDKPFLLELKDIKSLDTRYDPYGRRTAVWSAGVAQVLSVGGENGPPPPITLEPDEHLVIKASWQLPHLRMHEHNVYKHIAKTEEELRRTKGFVRDKEVAIPEMIGTLHDRDPPLDCIGGEKLTDWRTRLVRSNPRNNDPQAPTEQVHFTVLVTQCPRAQPVKRYILEEYQLVEIFRRLINNLKHLGLLGIHYRDLNIGNILCDPKTLICLLADLDFARIGTNRRGERSDDDASKLFETSLDDCISGNLLFMSQHVQQSRKLYVDLNRLEGQLWDIEETARMEDLAKEGQSDKVRQTNEAERDMASKDIQDEIDRIKGRIANNHHKFVDDLESLIYTKLWLFADQISRMSGLQCGPRFPIGNLYVPSIKAKVWAFPGKYAEGLGSQDWRSLISELAVLIKQAQRNTRNMEPTGQLEGPELSSYNACDSPMKAFYETHRPKGDEAGDAESVASGDSQEQEQEQLQNSASASPEGASAESASPNAGPLNSIRSKLRPRETKINYRL